LFSHQDCFGGCTDPNQGFYGYMDEVRLWKTVRTQDEIMKHMRWASGLENNKDLAAYWKFNDPDNDNGQFRRHVIAKDSSGKGNDLSLINPPFRTDVEIKGSGGSLHTGKLEFKNNLAVDKTVKGMPDKSFTVEFWARGKKLSKAQTSQVGWGGFWWGAGVREAATGISSSSSSRIPSSCRSCHRPLDVAVHLLVQDCAGQHGTLVYLLLDTVYSMLCHLLAEASCTAC
jgi:hypothetical protein